MNRRVFLANVATAGAAVGFGAPATASPAVSSAAPGVVSTADGVGAAAAGLAPASRPLNRQLFLDAMHARFSVRAGGAGKLALVDVVDGRPARGLDQFAVHFRAVGVPGPMLRAGIHTLAHPTHGEMELYLEPVADSPNGPAYRATLCLLS